MGKIIGSARLAHHTLTGVGLTFSVPTSEDFTDGTWTIKDLALSEIGVNEADKKAYIRIDNEIKEIQLAGGTSSAEPLSTTLIAGNTTGANDIIVEQNITTLTGGTYLDINDGFSEFSSTGVSSSSGNQTTDIISLDPTETNIGTSILSNDDVTGNQTSLIMTPYSGFLQSIDTSSNVSSIDVNTSFAKISSNNTINNSKVSVFPNAIDIITDNQILLQSIPGSYGTRIIIQPGIIEKSIKSVDNLGVDNGSISTSKKTALLNTSNNTPIGIYVPQAINGSYWLDVKINGYKDDYTKGLTAKLFAGFLHKSGTYTQLSTTDTIIKTNFSTATVAINISGTLGPYIQVTGEAVTNITWEITYEYIRP